MLKILCINHIKFQLCQICGIDVFSVEVMDFDEIHLFEKMTCHVQTCFTNDKFHIPKWRGRLDGNFLYWNFGFDLHFDIKIQNSKSTLKVCFVFLTKSSFFVWLRKKIIFLNIFLCYVLPKIAQVCGKNKLCISLIWIQKVV